MAEKKVFAYHKHLLIMQSRRDIILENDFINVRTKNNNSSFHTKYTQKFTSNKMRMAYLLAFAVTLQLSPIYDFIFESKTYHRLTTRLYQNQKLPAIQQFNEIEPQYDQNGAKLGNYFLNLQKVLGNRQITAGLLSNRISDFSQFPYEALTINSFVKFCQERQISTDSLPSQRSFQ